MGGYVSSNLHKLKRRHYVRKATTDNYWFDFSRPKLEGYCSRFGDAFCLVINGSDTKDETYIIPFEVVKCVFVKEATDDRNRWMGTIDNGILKLSVTGNSISVRAYHNAFKYLNC